MRNAFRVIRTVREKHTCTKCDAIVQAPAPSRPIERGIGLLASVLASKYTEHTPLYRRSEKYARQGVEPFCAVGLGGCVLSPVVTPGRSPSGLYTER